MRVAYVPHRKSFETTKEKHEKRLNNLTHRLRITMSSSSFRMFEWVVTMRFENVRTTPVGEILVSVYDSTDYRLQEQLHAKVKPFTK